MSPARSISLETVTEEPWCGIPVLPGLDAGITLASAGDMGLSREHSLPWRAAFRERRGLPREHVYALRQVHSRRVEVVDGQTADEAAGTEADGLVTARADPVLTVTVADCLPIYLADRENGVYGIVHSGWKGTGIVLDALALMASRFGSRPAGITAVIGPGIGACCYAVPEERAALFSSRHGPGSVARKDGLPPSLDLRAANILLLERAGVGDIGVVAECTACSPRLGSFRRQGASGYTLMLAWIRRRRETPAPGEPLRSAGGSPPAPSAR
jgi:YfiH family protein